MRKNKLLLLLALLLTAVTGARADWTGGTYTATATENLGAITVNGDATLTINSDVTVTITGGINVASGTLTVTGPGTLVVNGAKGNNGASGWEGSNGSNGGVAISGNIIVQGGATVTATGGNGGTGGSGALEAGSGGNGGVAFAGTLTYKSGTVTANGGSAGSGGYIEDEEENASSGSAGKAFANDVDFTQTTGYSVTNGTSTIGSVLNQTKVVISGGTDPAAAAAGYTVSMKSGTKDADKWTVKVGEGQAQALPIGGLKGDGKETVTLQYTGRLKVKGVKATSEAAAKPAATVTTVPQAKTDVEAGSTTALIEAGVADGGTLWYAVTTTNTKPASTDGFSDTVPTAETITASGKVYVWYYVKGDDTHSDSEIAGPVSVTVTPALSLTNPVVGQVIGSDGKNYAAASVPSGVTKVAMIAYVSGSNGLAIALADEGSLNWATAKSTCEAKTPAFTNGTWHLPSQAEWNNMFSANGGDEESYTGLNAAINTAGGTTLQSGFYWSSSEYSPGVGAHLVHLDDGDADWSKANETLVRKVRACLAFTVEQAAKPAATVTTAPTGAAIVGVGKTTALVSGGVADGGTLWYAVTTTNTKPASTDGFSDTVPTAETITASGKVYVWYYVKGDDTHSDSEIAATAIEVPVADIVWDATNLSDLYVSGTYASSTIEGITLSGNADQMSAMWNGYGDPTHDGIAFNMNESGGYTFTAPNGKAFTKIVMKPQGQGGWDMANLGTGWTFNADYNEDIEEYIFTVTWKGNAAASTVVLLKDADMFAGETISYIVFYLSDAE